MVSPSPRPSPTSTARPPKPITTPTSVRVAGRSPVAIRTSTAQAGTPATRSAVTPEAMPVVWASAWNPLPSPRSSTPVSTSERSSGPVTRRPAGPRRTSTMPTRMIPASTNRCAIAWNGSTSLMTSRMAR